MIKEESRRRGRAAEETADCRDGRRRSTSTASARARVTRDRVKELEDFGLIEATVAGGSRAYAESDVDVAAACEALRQFGIGARNLKSSPRPPIASRGCSRR